MKRLHRSALEAFIALFATLCVLQASKAETLKVSDDRVLIAQAATAKGKKAATKTYKMNVDKNGVILKGYDAVAYFTQQKAVKGDPKFSSKYRGATFYFASAADKSAFDKNPGKYSPRYGGYCARGMSRGQLRDSDPNAFWIYEGKLYVCENAEAAKDFNSNPKVNIKKADENWKNYELPESPGFNRELGS